MSSMSLPAFIRLLCLAVVLLPVQPLLAQEQEKESSDDARERARSEIVYYVNLGRADDLPFLLKHGSTLDDRDDNNVPLLALAAMRKDKEGPNMVKALIKFGADLNARDDEGRTALFYAAKQGNLDIAITLMEAGIDYYAVDKHGDVARNIAYREGHVDVMQAMDEFVKQKTQKINDEYTKAHQQLQEQYQKLSEDQQKEQERLAAEKKAIEAAKASLATQPTAEEKTEDEAKAKAQAEAEAKAIEEAKAAAQARAAEEKTAKEKKRAEALAQHGQELSFHNCAFQYWSFCKAVGQYTALSKDELYEAIEGRRTKILEMNAMLMKDYDVSSPALSKIADSAMRRIYNQLQAMPSKSYRREHGVGTPDDMQERCEDIAHNWQEPPPEVAKPNTEKNAAPVNHSPSNFNGITKHR